MPLRKFVLVLSLAGATSLAAWCVVVWFIDPTQTGVLGIILFYATLACAVFALVLLLGLSGRMLLKRLHRETMLAFHIMLPTVRQAVWCSAIVVISLILAANQLFSWFSAVVLILFFTLLEGFLYSIQPQLNNELTSDSKHEPEPTPQ
ncbi:MAG: hypothetical protein HY565_05740 [Candidatus Kerfeldbacteria bacterium]|nr:hypothetical protein [Candidatus Kerfeldbacteria bacterium]